MKRPLYVAVLGLLFAAAGSVFANPLTFEVPTGWKSEHKSAGDFYSLTAKAPNGGLLMFSPWPPPAKCEDIPALVRKLAEGFAQRAKEMTNVTFATYDFEIKQFSGSACNGSYAVFNFTPKNGTSLVQSVFMMCIGDQVWNGQFTGPQDAWNQALGVLRSIKKND
jgi:hypothetical protein